LLFDAIRLAYLIRSAYRLNPNIKIARRYLDRRDLTKLFGYSFYAFAIVMGRQLIFYTDSIVIGLFLGTAMVTLYFVASRLVLYLRLLVSEMVGVLMPTTSDLGARDDQDGIRELLVISTKYMLLIAFPVAAVFFSIGGTFIALWMGPEYTSSTSVLTLLTIAMLAHFMEMPAHTVLLGLCKHRVVALFTLFQAVVNLGLSIILVRKMGIVGVALGTTIPMVGFTAVALVVYFRGFLKLPLGEYLRRSCIGPILVQIPFIAALILIVNWRPPASLVSFFSEIGLALIPYSVVVLATCVSRNERMIFLRALQKFGFKLAPRLGGTRQAVSVPVGTSYVK
ncbi:MAG: lipopolysaccharide biosynthesis protein, partial [Blastocatellia bacterium]